MIDAPRRSGFEYTILGGEYFAFDKLESSLILLLDNRGYLNQSITHRCGVGETGKVIIEQ